MLNEEQKNRLTVEIATKYSPAWSDTVPALYVLNHDFDFSVRDIAALLDVTHPNLSYWMNGKKPVPQKHKQAIAELLGDSIEAAKAALTYLKVQKDIKVIKEPDPFSLDDPEKSYDAQIQILENVISRAEMVLKFA